MSLTGHVANGTIILDNSATLPEGAKVRIEVMAEENHKVPDPSIPTLYDRLRSVVGKVQAPPDASLNHDHYLYGQPKK